MGCDGGTIPTRDELVRTRKKPEQKDKDADRAHKWQNCAITQEPLRQPIVACELGRLYNKESILELVLDCSKFECASSFQHIKGMKDVKVLNLTDNPAFIKPDNDKGDAYVDRQAAPYICPVVGIEMNGKYRFCFSWSCGCVVSERAVKEVKTEVCHKCGKNLNKSDVIIMNGNDDDVEDMTARLEARRLEAKLKKKAKKHKVDTDSSDSSLTSNGSTDQPTSSKLLKLEKESSKGKLLTNGSSDHKQKGQGKSLSNGKTDLKPKSIQNDPSASKVYKSLFTSSEKGQQQKSAHWVTFNPQYF